MSDLVFILLLGHAALLSIIAVVVSECRHYERKFKAERDLTHRLMGHLTRLQSERSGKVVPFARRVK